MRRLLHASTGRAPGTALVLLLLAVFASCSRRRPEYPVTERGHPFHAENARLVGTAPPVTATVTSRRIAGARSEPQNWLTYYGTYDGQRYSTLGEITTANVGRLRPAWVFQYPLLGLSAAQVTYSWEAAPIVVDGVMFLSGPDGYVWALDAANGRMLWQYQHATPIDVPLCCGNVNRGVAVARGKVFVVTLNAWLVALDATNGKVLWRKPFGDVRAGESATLAPLVVKELVIVGNSGAEYGVRGHIDAFDVETGERRWRRYTVPKPGEPGSETWGKNDAWSRGGGTAWITGTYDPELDLLYWGTGNPGAVFNGDDRPGDNLYTSSVLALDPDDGAIRWHYQWTPHDVWDYDGINESILIDRDGRKLLAHFDRNGYFFVLDRTNGRFVRASRYARADWGDIDPTTGKVTARKIPTDSGTHICPGPAGSKVWNHAAYSPRTGLLYTPVIELCAIFTKSEPEFRESMPYLGSAVQTRDQEEHGFVKAVDPATGREAWAWRSRHPVVSSVLATGGDLVFAGEATGEFNAYDARDGRLLWQFQTGSGIHGNPVTYAVGGKQYVAVPSGWGGWLEGFSPRNYGGPRGASLMVFSLP